MNASEKKILVVQIVDTEGLPTCIQFQVPKLTNLKDTPNIEIRDCHKILIGTCEPRIEKHFEYGSVKFVLSSWSLVPDCQNLVTGC